MNVHDPEWRRLARVPSVFVAVAALTVAAYMAWLGWDTEYDVDPVTGVVSGPYQPWQVIGLAICLGSVAAVAGWIGRRGVCALAMPLAFAVCFGVNASASPNDDGLWVVGMILASVGILIGVTVVGAGAGMASRWWRSRAG